MVECIPGDHRLNDLCTGWTQIFTDMIGEHVALGGRTLTTRRI